MESVVVSHQAEPMRPRGCSCPFEKFALIFKLWVTSSSCETCLEKEKLTKEKKEKKRKEKNQKIVRAHR